MKMMDYAINCFSFMLGTGCICASIFMIILMLGFLAKCFSFIN